MPRSSAYGYAQALEGTWDDYRRSTGRRGADRDDFADSSDFIGWYMHGANRVNGVAMHDAYNQYLAYHEGKAGFARGSYAPSRGCRRSRATSRPGRSSMTSSCGAARPGADG